MRMVQTTVAPKRSVAPSEVAPRVAAQAAEARSVLRAAGPMLRAARPLLRERHPLHRPGANPS
jgi:hypothetical protein